MSGKTGHAMALELDDLLDNMHGALRFFLAHLNNLRDEQWDWKPSAANRSIREILGHLCETYEDKAALEEELARPLPRIAQVQRLFEATAKADYARLCEQYAGTPLETEIPIAGGDWFLRREAVRVAALLMRRSWEECYHTGQVVFIRLATDPDWDQEEEVYGRT